jgi:hypothetical protein
MSVVVIMILMIMIGAITGISYYMFIKEEVPEEVEDVVEEEVVPVDTYVEYANTNGAGSLFSSLDTPTIEECRNNCNYNDKCHFYNYTGTKCSMYELKPNGDRIISTSVFNKDKTDIYTIDGVEQGGYDIGGWKLGCVAKPMFSDCEQFSREKEADFFTMHTGTLGCCAKKFPVVADSTGTTGFDLTKFKKLQKEST